MTKEGGLPKRSDVGQEDAELIELSEDDLRKRTAVFSFDQILMRDRLNSGEDWHKVVMGHLYVDHIFINMLAEALPNSASIKLSRLGFQQKLELVDAMGLVPKELVGVANLINRIRNKIAHSLDFSITEKDQTDLRNSVPKDMRDALTMANVHSIRFTIDESGVPNLSGLLFVTVLQTDLVRQQNAYRRLSERRARAKLAQALKDYDEGTSGSGPAL